MDLSPKFSKLPITKSCNVYVKLKPVFNKNLLFGYYLRLILLTRQSRGVNSSKASQVCYKKVYGNKYLREYWQKIHVFSKIYIYMESVMIKPYHGMNHGKHGNHTMNHDDHDTKYAVILAWSWPCLVMIMVWS